jgi:hypothetical protein
MNHRWLALGFVGLFGCASSSGGNGASPGESPDGSADGSISTTAEDYDAGPESFDCLENSEWVTVGVSRYKNMLGHTDEMLAVARSADGGVFPVGTIVQLVPLEASVKRGAGFNPQSNDWEFFSLGTSSTGTTIMARGGGASVKNFVDESCLDCHDKAAPQWDFICGDQDGGNTHGCADLPLSGSQLAMLQNSDARCHD